MHYYFVDQIERKILELLLIELLEYCKTFSLIWRNEFYDRSYKKYHDEFIANLEKFIIKQEKVFSWPGTRITGIPATRYTFDFSEDSLNVLLKYLSIYSCWGFEDFSLQDQNDIPVLTTISHEHIAFLDIEDSIYQNLIKDIPLLKDFLVKSETYTPSYAVVRINNDIDCTSYSHPIGIIKFFDIEEMADSFCETQEELKSSECFYMVVPFLGELPKIHHTTSRAESNKKDCFLA